MVSWCEWRGNGYGHLLSLEIKVDQYHKFLITAQTKTQDQIHNQTESKIKPNYKQQKIKITIQNSNEYQIQITLVT